MLFRRVNPYNGVNPNDPTLSYIIRHVRGGRTPQGAVVFGWVAATILAALILSTLGLFLWLYVGSRYRSEYWYIESTLSYALVLLGIAIGMFPIVDFFTIFFAANSIRSEIKNDIKFDLLRVSLISPENYVEGRLALARVRAWRIFVFMWLGRLFAVSLLGVVGLMGLWALISQEGLSWVGWDDTSFWQAIGILLVAGTIFIVQLLAEPLWRLDMLTALGASVAARVRSGPGMWLGLGISMAAVAFLQGALAVGVVWLARGLNGFSMWLARTLIPDIHWAATDFIGTFALLLPFLLMPPVVWLCQRSFRRWRQRVTVRYIFRHQGVDA